MANYNPHDTHADATDGLDDFYPTDLVDMQVRIQQDAEDRAWRNRVGDAAYIERQVGTWEDELDWLDREEAAGDRLDRWYGPEKQGEW